MRVSAKAEYACVAILELAAQYGSPTPVTVKAIADTHGISQRYLVQILLQLKGAGYVASTRGSSGGYLLAQPPAEISVADIMTVIDGPFAIRHEPAASLRSPATHAVCAVWNRVMVTEKEMLEEVTFADLVRQLKKPVDQMYYI